jgi:hypothetical protein
LEQLQDWLLPSAVLSKMVLLDLLKRPEDKMLEFKHDLSSPDGA